MSENKYILFDWAFKYMLRDKANFDILEGFLSELIERDVTILRLLESESNQQDEFAKYNRADILAELNPGGELVVIEMQLEADVYFFKRLHFSAARLAHEYLDKGEGYGEVKKIISVSIIFFRLGVGKDYVYVGRNDFRGLHLGDVLELSSDEKDNYDAESVSDVYPQYYLISLKNYDQQLDTPLDQWIYFLKNSELPPGYTAKGLKAAETKLTEMQMPREQRRAYENYAHERRKLIGMMTAQYQKGLGEGFDDGFLAGATRGLEEGRAEGRKEGEANARQDIARNMLAAGAAPEAVAQATGLSHEEVEALREA